MLNQETTNKIEGNKNQKQKEPNKHKLNFYIFIMIRLFKIDSVHFPKNILYIFNRYGTQNQ